MATFRKLVRDKIPERMESEGEKPVVRILDDAEYLKALENKLLEEVQELRVGTDDKKMEIADIYEVLDALIAANQFSKDEIFKIQAAKRVERGAFEKRIFLESAE